ncbi:hypothetical protein FA13DRAFT_1813413 [Coprinellus micaceus]|uniref:F-box domain-containing protein n=1 Tax=Coprinellus micaceus TaxID=71717 RepID=A0A4Y7TEA8_COPMI|nr:hypothetical protein FA13DRAFT_1813413 [Coprinellus micaceus]
MAVVQCLQLPEIVRSICDESTKSSPLSVALTCRSLLEPALDSLWRDIDSFNAIAAALPRDLWHWQRRTNSNDSIPVVSFMRGIKSHDLERYLTFYACRIRKLAPILSSRDKIFSIEFFQALGLVTGHRPGALTPRLKKLLWPSPDAIGKWLGGDSRLLTPHINLFLSETVSSFTAFDCGVHLQSTYLTYIIDHLPNLEDLDLRALAPRRIEGIQDSSWRNLETLKLPPFSEGLLATLVNSALLPQLRSLRIQDFNPFHLPDPNSQGRRPTEGNALPSLRRLFVQTPALLRIGDLLDLLFRDSGNAQMIALQAKKCNHQALEYLTMPDFDQPVGRDNYDQVYLHRYANPDLHGAPAGDPIDISPLHSFHKLRILDIRLRKVDVHFAPEHIAALSASWPSLRVLNLSPYFPSDGRLPSINHSHILQLLDSSPFLRELGLRFDTTQIMARDSTVTPQKQYPRLRVLHVGDSPISSPLRVVAFIKAYFPRLEELHTTVSGPETPDMTMAERRWLAVVRGAWKTTHQ